MPELRALLIPGNPGRCSWCFCARNELLTHVPYLVPYCRVPVATTSPIVSATVPQLFQGRGEICASRVPECRPAMNIPTLAFV
jgi:hypothetical protein